MDYSIKDNNNLSFVILASHGELFFENLIQLLLVCSGDIEINPGPKTKNQNIVLPLEYKWFGSSQFN